MEEKKVESLCTEEGYIRAQELLADIPEFARAGFLFGMGLTILY